MEAALVTPLDIRYLLLLQTFREQIHDRLTPLMESVSLFSITYLIVLPILVYWMIDKKSGLYTLASYSLCYGINAIVKLTVCAYRPWIRDPRIRPAGDSIRTAGGYSFPSGHTSTAGPIYGGMAVSARKRWKWLSAFGVFMILLTGFSRNYLGVHTPQDVFVAIFESVASLLVVAKIFDEVQAHPEKENRLLLLCAVFGVIAMVYVSVKPYPMTYVNGSLLVDPKSMVESGYSGIALLIAFPAARYVEKTWVRFEATGVTPRGVLLCAIGSVGLWLILDYAKSLLSAWMGRAWGRFAYTWVLIFYSVALYPMILKRFSGKND